MAADDQRGAEPVTFAGGVLDRYRHVCAFVNQRSDQDGVFDSFISQGIDGGDRLLYVVDPAESAAPVNRLRHLGYDAAKLLEHHRCEVHTWTNTYLRDDRFDAAATLELLEHALVRQLSSRVRIMCDMDWAAGRPGVVDRLIEVEAKVNFIHAGREHVVICSYDYAKFDGAFIVDVLRTHPMVLIGGMLQENPFFVPPSEFLEERATRADR